MKGGDESKTSPKMVRNDTFSIQTRYRDSCKIRLKPTNLIRLFGLDLGSRYRRYILYKFGNKNLVNLLSVQ